MKYTTQMDAAKKGIITEQMKVVAEKEGIDVEAYKDISCRRKGSNSC